MNGLWLLILVSFMSMLAAAGPILASKTILLTDVTSLYLATEPSALGIAIQLPRKAVHRISPVKWKRKYLKAIFRELGPSYQKRAYRMNPKSFWKLHQLLKPYMQCGRLKRMEGSPKKNVRNGAVNGSISSVLRLSAAI